MSAAREPVAPSLCDVAVPIVLLLLALAAGHFWSRRVADGEACRAKTPAKASGPENEAAC